MKKLKRLFWTFVHNVVSHPLMCITFNSRFSIWFHDKTAKLAFYHD